MLYAYIFSCLWIYTQRDIYFYSVQVNLVVNYDLPVKYDARTEPDYEVYLHRVGRAGRFGRKGNFLTWQIF